MLVIYWALKGYKFAQLTCKLLVHYLGKCEKVIYQQYIVVI